MIRNLQIHVCLAALCLVVFGSLTAAQAADEDTTASVYLVFDPDTGEFIEVNDEDRTQQKHDALDPANAALAIGSSNSRSGAKLSLMATLATVAGLLAIVFIYGHVTRTGSGNNNRRPTD